MTSKLEQARRQDAIEKRGLRRAAWKEETGKEIEKRRQFQQQQVDFAAFHKVADSKDKQVMSRMSLQGSKRLKKWRTVFLFDEVLKVLYGKGCFDLRERDWNTQRLLRWRAVCKEWKRSIEHCLSSAFSPSLEYRNVHGESLSLPLPLCFRHFGDSAELKRFSQLSNTSYTGGNPFPSRKLIIGRGSSLPTWEANQEYWRTMKSMLRRWGKELWHIYLHFDLGMFPEVYYAELCEYLKLMPNLRCVGVYLKRVDHRLPPHSNVLKRFQEQVHGPLSELMSRIPLPELPHLTSLLFDDHVPPVIINAALSRYGSQLNSLSFEFAAPSKLKVFRSLSNRALPQATEEGSLPLVEQMELHYYNMGSPADVVNIFKKVNSHGKVLKSLDLKLHNTELAPLVRLPDDLLKGLVLELPRLEILNLSVARINLKTADFLLPCVSLKKLDLKYTEVVPDLRRKAKRRGRDVPALREKIQFNQFTKRLYDSNIWRLLPGLQQVTIQIITQVRSDNCQGFPATMRVDGSLKIEGPEELPLDSKADLLRYTRKGYQRHLKTPKINHGIPRKVITYSRYLNTGHQIVYYSPY